MTRYHGAAPRPIARSNPAPRPPTDRRDEWRRAIAGDRTLKSAALRLAVCLLNFANGQGYTTVGVGRLMEETGRDRRHVERAIAELVGGGWLTREARAGAPGRGGRTCKTRLTLPGSNTATDGDSARSRDALESTGTPSPEVPVGGAESTGGNAPKYRYPSAGETLLTLRKEGDAPGLEAGAAAEQPENAPPGSGAAALGGIVRSLSDLVARRAREAPQRSRAEILAGLRARFTKQGTLDFAGSTIGPDPVREDRHGDDRPAEAK